MLLGKGLIYTNIMPRGTTINANYTLKALGKIPGPSEEEARGGPAGMVFPLGKPAHAHCSQCEEVICQP
jgi:hypothetical protein